MSAPALLRTLGIALLLALVAACSDDPQALVVHEGATTTTTTTTTTVPTTTTSAAARPQADGHRRVLVVGDSLVFGAVPALDAALSEQRIETRYVGYPGTGLLSGQGWWNREITAQVEAWHPDVVVIEACCNYASGEPESTTEDGGTIAPDSGQMYEAWAAAAADAVERAGAEGAPVLWVTTPCVAETLSGALRTRVDRFEQIVDGLGVERIDWAGALCPGGRYTPTLDVDGTSTEVRSADGLHLTDAGDAVVADVTAAALAHLAWS